ncbi:MAG: histidine phosphatase family protein [Pseudomonadota bacterium]|nr:histidine phosphatase family protein [Pseudomonadota bacterium]
MYDENTHHRITLIRHAKSSWSDPRPADFDRPLNKRGKRDAPRVGRYLAEAGIDFDLVLCSQASRARKTLRGLRTELAIDDHHIEYRQDLYLASSTTIKSIIAECPSEKRDVAVIAHNPGLENLAWDFSNRSVDRMPTCCVVRFSFENSVDSWEQGISGDGKVELYLLARNLE